MKKKKLKKAFLIFSALALGSVFAGVSYLQSERFARVVKRMISDQSPERFGIVGDFSYLNLHFFPPGVGLVNPKIRVLRDNISNLPIEGTIEAKEMSVTFAPIQMLSGTLVVSEVSIDEGAVIGRVGKEAFKRKPKVITKQKFSWQELIELQVHGIRFIDTYLNLEAEVPNSNTGSTEALQAECVVKLLSLSKEQYGKTAKIFSSGLVNAVRFSIPSSILDLPFSSANQLQWRAELSDLELKLHPFRAEVPGTSVEVNGVVTGNILDPDSPLSLVGEADVRSDLNTFFEVQYNRSDVAGQVEVGASFKADLRDFEKSLEAKFKTTGRDVYWGDIYSDEIEGEGELNLGKNQIQIEHLELKDKSHTPAGLLEIRSTTLPLGFDQPFESNLTFKDADLHWLGAAVLKAIFGLEGKINGNLQASFDPGKKKANQNSWQVQAKTQLKVHQFALTNQVVREERPKSFILRPSFPVALDGPLSISAQGVKFDHLRVSLKETHFDVVGGVSGKTGYGFRATGPVLMDEFDSIAENKITGKGSMSVHVHGPVEHVLLDFEPEFKDASYMGLQIGTLKGRVTFDDGVTELRFSNIQAEQGRTFYSLSEGRIDLAGSDVIHLPFQIHSGRIEELAKILTPVVSQVEWYPHDLVGTVKGKIVVGGKLTTPKLEIRSELEGSDWQWKGERARSFKAKIGFDKGLYYARNVSVVKTQGEIFGNIELNSPNQRIKWGFGTAGFTLADIDFMERLGLPARSKIEIRSRGEGLLDKIKSKSEARFYATEVKGEQLEPTHVDLEIGENNIIASIEVFGDSLKSKLKYSLLAKQPSYLHIDFNRFDFSPAILILNPKLLDDSALDSSVNGKIRLDFLSDQFELARGEVSIDEYRLQKTGFKVDMIDPIEMQVQLGYFNLPETRLKFKNSELKINGEGRKGNLDLSVTGNYDLAVSELFTPAIEQLKGVAKAEVRFTGPVKELKVNGDINFKNANLVMSFLQTPFEELEGAIHIRQGMVFVERVDAYLGDQVFSMSGRMETFSDRFPELDLRARFEDNKIKMLPLDLVQVRGLATIKGVAPPYVIGGNLEIVQALWTKSFSGAGGSAQRGERFAPKNQDAGGISSLFKMDLNLNANKGFVIKNEIIDAEFKGKVTMVGAPENPSLLGEGSLIQGKVLFRDRPFVFESVKIEFDDPYQLNPKFSATAVSEINQYRVKVLAYGRTDSWKAEFSSSPFLVENEIYSLLATGLTATENSRFRNRDRTYVNQGEAASLILHSLDFSKDVQSRTGFQFDVEEALDAQSASSIFSPQSVGNNVAAPKVVLKRKVGSNVGVSFGSTVGVGSQNQREVNAEYNLTRGISVLGVWTNIEEVNTRETRTSYGLDLKFNKKFK